MTRMFCYGLHLKYSVALSKLKTCNVYQNRTLNFLGQSYLMRKQFIVGSFGLGIFVTKLGFKSQRGLKKIQQE
jgi:hypothetical protein